MLKEPFTVVYLHLEKAKMLKKQNTIKIKVIGWFLLAALAVLLTGIISYNSYRELLRSLEYPSNQQTKLKELGDIMAYITEAEAKMRAYALTRDLERRKANINRYCPIKNFS